MAHRKVSLVEDEVGLCRDCGNLASPWPRWPDFEQRQKLQRSPAERSELKASGQWEALELQLAADKQRQARSDSWASVVMAWPQERKAQREALGFALMTTRQHLARRPKWMWHP